MRGKSHTCLGHYLADHYMPTVPKRYRLAFLLGCIEPDRNPATYLKGSLRCQWLRGHNFLNAQNYMGKVARRLERKQRLHLLDYYALGKLIHYTTDAFTSAHNSTFPEALDIHREYEAGLQDYFLRYMANRPSLPQTEGSSIMQSIRRYHRDYIRRPTHIRTDSRFALLACCSVMAVLMPV